MASLGVQITVLVLIVLAVLACLAIVIGFIIRAKLKQRREYIRLEIDKSITSTRPQPTGPTLAEKREDALRNVQFYLRTSKFDLVGPLWNIGSCEKKFHFQLNSPRESGLFLLTLHMKGENSKLPLTSLSLRQTIKKLLKEIKHPYILPSLKVDFLQGQKVVLLTIRPFSEKRGSIRDLVYKTKPSKGFQAKYFDETRPGHALGSKYVRQFGRQILEALDFLQINGFPYPDLHCGNVIVIDGICKLTDYEKVILGQEAHYASFSKGQNMLRDFANVLFEMSCGFEPTKKDIKYPPEKCNEQVAEIIHSIYFREQPATLDELLAHPFFDVTPKGLSEFSGEDLDLSKPEYVKLLQALTGQKTLVKKKKRPPPPEQVKKEPAKPSPAPAPASAPQAANNAPPPPPPPKDLPKPPAGAPDKSSLLADIRKPNKSKLKKVTQINDRSSPSI